MIVEKADIIRVTKIVPFEEQINIEIRLITEENVNDGLTFNSPEEIESFKQDIIVGHKGFYAYYNGVCAFRAFFFNSGDRCLIGSNFIYDLPSDECFLAWVKTHPEYYKLGLYTSVLKYAIFDNPSKVISGYVASDNIGSLKGSAKAGFEVMERYILFVLFGRGFKVKIYEVGKGRVFKFSFGRVIKPLKK